MSLSSVKRSAGGILSDVNSDLDNVGAGGLKVAIAFSNDPWLCVPPLRVGLPFSALKKPDFQLFLL